MAHNKTKPSLYVATLVIGIPGVGLETLAKLLQWYYLDGLGYRSSHANPQEWLWSLDRLWYKMTDPGKPFNCIGFAQNWQATIYWPWKHVIALELDKNVWRDRFIGYRQKHNIEGDHETAFEHAYNEQVVLIETINMMCLSETTYTILSYDKETPTEVVSAIKNVLKGYDHEDDTSRTETSSTTTNGKQTENKEEEKV